MKFSKGEVIYAEGEIVREQGVSRTVVREALSKLQAAGLVETRHGIVAHAAPTALLALAIPILEPHGWTKAGKRIEDGAQLWVRPGKDAREGHSAVTDPYGVPVMVNFSATAGLPTGPGQRLTKFKVWAFLNYGGDLTKARAALEDAAAEDPTLLAERAARFIPLDWPTVFAGADEPIDWLVEPFLEKGAQVAFYSKAKAGKTP